MKPRLILHIGSPKTGSSSIQKALFDSRRKLRETCDVHFASTDRAKAHDKHLSTTKASVGNDTERAEVEYNALIDDFERSGAAHLLVTEEQMWTSKPSVARFFKRFTSTFDVDVVAYVRRQDLFVEGLYSQHMRLSHYRDVPPITEFWRDKRLSTMLDYHKVLMRLQDAGLNVKVLEFSKEVKEFGLMQSFLRATGLTKIGELPDKSANTSPDMRLLLTLCLLSTGRLEGEHQNLINGIFRAGRRLEQCKVFPVMKHTLGSIERQAIITDYAESNENLARDFGITFSDSRPQEGEMPILTPDASYLLALIGDMALTDSVKLFNCCRAYLETMAGVLPASVPGASDADIERLTLADYESVKVEDTVS